MTNNNEVQWIFKLMKLCHLHSINPLIRRTAYNAATISGKILILVILSLDRIKLHGQK